MNSEFSVTTHAAIRMCERAFKLENPTPKQIQHASDILKHEMLIDNMQEIDMLCEGSFLIKDYDIYAIVKNKKVLTVKLYSEKEDNPKLNGGICNSGSKYAKKKRRSYQTDIVKTGSKIKKYKRKEPRPKG